MKYEFGVTIATDLALEELNPNSFPHVSVLDLRHRPDNQAQAIEESCLKRLRNLQVEYQQLPVNLDRINSRTENRLFQTIVDQCGNLLILTHDPEGIARFCNGLDIPVRFRRLRLLSFSHEPRSLPHPLQAQSLCNAAG